MAGVVDTNILLYAANKDAPEHGAASRFLKKAVASPERWYLTEGIVYEFLRVTTHPKVFPRPLAAAEALSFVRSLLESQAFEVLAAGEKHWHALGEVVAGLRRPSGNLFFDVRTAALMREHGIREIYTADADFKLFTGIKVINPVGH
jgi:toxin-antitoxin system PIN domain toxin